MTEPVSRPRRRRRRRSDRRAEREAERLATEFAEPATESGKRRRRWAWVVAWLVATALLVVCFRFIGASQLLALAARTDPVWVVMSFAANFAIQLCAAAMWRLLLPPTFHVPFRRMLGIMFVGSLVVNTTPMLVGHASIALMLSRQRGVGNAAALSVLALDQLAEGLSKLAVIVLALMLVPVPGWLRQGGIVLTVVMLGLLAILFVAAHHHEAITRWAHSRHAATKFLAKWARHMETLRTPRRFALAWVASLGMKAFELAGIVAAQQALGVELPLAHSLLVLAAAGLGTILPVTPGNLGMYEGAVLLAYRFLGLDAQTAFALALVQHLILLGASTVPGWVHVSARQLRRA